MECGELPLDLRGKKLMANHILRSIATQNKSVNNKYFISNGRKSKAQARLRLMMMKNGISTPVEPIEFLLPRDLLRDIVEEAHTTSPWRLKMPEIDTSNLSVAADNPEEALCKGENRGSPRKPPLLNRRLQDFGRHGRIWNIHSREASLYQPQDVKSKLHTFDRTSSY